MAAGRGKLIAIEGPDGSGKTTLARAVAAAGGALFVEKKTIAEGPPYVAEVMAQVREQLWPMRAPESRQHFGLFPDTYWIHLQATWYVLFAEFVVAPHLARGTVVVVDGWIYKFIAKLIAKGMDRGYLETALAGVPPPDHVFLLRVPAQDIWRRSAASRRTFNELEMGSLNGFLTLGEPSFVSHQSDVAAELSRMAVAARWTAIDVATGEGQETTGLRLRERIATLL